MQIDCPKCGTENWLENQSKCFSCGAVLRRCVDCTHYDRQQTYCDSIRSEISLYEAENPGVLATSANCQSYRPVARLIHRSA